MSGGRILATVLAVILAYSIGVVLLLNWDDVSNRWAQWTGNQTETTNIQQPRSGEPDRQAKASNDSSPEKSTTSKSETSNEPQATAEKSDGKQETKPESEPAALKKATETKLTADTKPEVKKPAGMDMSADKKIATDSMAEKEKTADVGTKATDQKVASASGDKSEKAGTKSREQSDAKKPAPDEVKTATRSADRENSNKENKRVAAKSPVEMSKEASTQDGDKAPSLAFDVVNIDKAGMGVIAGSGAEPGSRVVIESGGKVIGEEKAGVTGQWVIITDQALKTGDQLLTLKSITPDKSKETKSKQSLRVVVPDKRKTLPKVVLAEAGRTDKVLQEQRTTELAAKQPDNGTSDKKSAPKEIVTAGKSETPENKAGQPKETMAQSRTEDGNKVENRGEQKPQVLAEKPSIGERIKNLFTSDGNSKKEPSATVEKPRQPLHKGEPIPVALVKVNSVEYERSVENSGFLTLNGEGLPKTRIKLFLGGNPIGSTRVDDQGTWSFYKKIIIKPGKHMIRAEQVDQAGKTLALVNHAFERALPKAVTVARVNADPDDTKAEAVARTQSQQEPVKPAAKVKAPEQKTIVASRPEAKQKPTATDQSSSATKLQKEVAKKQEATEPRKSKTVRKKIGKKSVSKTRSKKSRRSKTRKSRTASKRKYRTTRKPSRASTVRLRPRHRDFFDHRRKHQSRWESWRIAHEKRMKEWRQEVRKRREAQRRSMARRWRQEKRRSNLPLCERR